MTYVDSNRLKSDADEAESILHRKETKNVFEVFPNFVNN